MMARGAPNLAKRDLRNLQTTRASLVGSSFASTRFDRLGLPGHSNLFEVHHHYVLSSDDLDAYDSDCDELIRQDCSHGQSLKDMAQMHSLRYKETVKIEEMENVEQFFRWSKKEPLPQLSLRAWGIVDVKKPFIKMEQAVAQHAWRPELSKLKMNQFGEL
ncbi:hypothetical protein Tco_1165605 [Tanacetum coccineum]